MTDEIKRNFEFSYFGRGRHLCPDLDRLDEPLRVLEKLGGQEVIKITEIGDEKLLGMIRQSDFEFRVFQFPQHPIKAYVTRETYPDGNSQNSEKPANITRIRLGNYDLKDDASFTREVSQRLSEIPNSD